MQEQLGEQQGEVDKQQKNLKTKLNDIEQLKMQLEDGNMSTVEKNKIFDSESPGLTGEDTREGITSVISCKVFHPQFEGQTKAKLGNSEVKGIVESIMYEKLSEFFEENPPVAHVIIDKAVLSNKAREAARKADMKRGNFIKKLKKLSLI
jgi:DNA gyrase/topoisomerase IV subunit B